MTAPRAAATALAVSALTAAGWLAGAAPAHAASCAAMSVEYGLPSGSGVVLIPPHVSIGYGGCVRFTNQTATRATITVAPGYSVTLGLGESTSGGTNYVGTAPGRHAVGVTSGPSSTGGSITVGAAPSRSSSPTPTASHSATPATSSASSPTPTRSAGGPQVAPRPARTEPRRPPTGPSPVRAAPPPTPSVAAPSPSRAAVAGGPVEPPTDRGTGLPAALAALAVVGTGGALLRVLLAEAGEAVDSRRTVGGAL